MDAQSHPFRTWRKKKGWNQAQMAKAIGASQARVSMFESGRVGRLTPEQARAAEKVSRGEVTFDDCVFRTPRVLLEKNGDAPPRAHEVEGERHHG